MKVSDLKDYFVTYTNAMRKLGLSESAYLHWRARDYIPYHQQLKIEKFTHGNLKADKKELVDEKVRAWWDRKKPKAKRK